MTSLGRDLGSTVTQLKARFRDTLLTDMHELLVTLKVTYDVIKDSLLTDMSESYLSPLR